MAPTLSDAAAEAALRRWMAGNETVKGLDKVSEIPPPRYELIPMWMIRAKRDGQESVFLEPAVAVVVSELKNISIPAANLEPYDHQLDDQALEPTVPYDTMLTWLQRDYRMNAAEITSSALVHLPFFHFKYRYDGEQYTAYVDAATGAVFASIFPTKNEVPYLGVAILAFAVYFALAFLPLWGIFAGRFPFSMLLYLVALTLSGVPLFMAAAYVSRKV